MFCWPLCRKGRKGDPPEPPALEAADRGVCHEPRAPEDSPGPTAGMDPEEFPVFRWHGQGWGPREAERSRIGMLRASRGAGESWRDTGMAKEAGDAPGCARVDGTELWSCRNGGGGHTLQEELKVESTPSGIQRPGEDVQDEPIVPSVVPSVVPSEARNGKVPREGTDQPQPLLQAGSSEDEEGESGSSSQSLECGMEGDGHGQELELRRWLRERLRRLGEDTERWEGKPTGELAAWLAQLIRMSVQRCPAEPGIGTICWEPGTGTGQDLELGVPDSGKDRSFVGMLGVCGNTESREQQQRDSEWGSEDSDSEQFVHPQIRRVQLSIDLEQEFPTVWARSHLDCGRLDEEEPLHGAPVPFQQQRPKPRRVEEQMAKLLREYLHEGIVVEGRSASNNPLILIPKSRGRGWRLTLQGRALNAATPAGPQERLDKAVIAASPGPRSRFFSVLDLSNACLAIPVTQSSRARLAFTFQGRQFLFTRLPPTFHGSNSILHRRVAAMLARLEPAAAAGVFHYYDDILIAGESWRQAEFRTRRVLELIQSTGFKVRREKVQLVEPTVKYLGITLKAEGRSIPEETVEQICQECDDPGPWNAARLRSILGKFGSWQAFIPDYSELALPLQRLVGAGRRKREREREWEWGQQQWRQLRQLKEALESAPTLRFPDKSQPFLIQISLHAETAAAALLQERAGILRPVAHCSHGPGKRPHSRDPRDMAVLEAVRAVRAFRAFTGSAPVGIQDPFENFLVQSEVCGSDGSNGSNGSGGTNGSGGSDSSQLPEQWTLVLMTEGPLKENTSQHSMILILTVPWLQQLPSPIPKANVWFLAVEKGPCRESPIGFAATSLDERWLLGASRGDSELEAELEALQELLEQPRRVSRLFLYCSRPALVEWLRAREKEPGPSHGGDAWPRILRWLRAFPGALSVRQVGTAGGRAATERAWIAKASARARARAAAGTAGSVWEPSKYEKQEIVARCHLRHEGVEGTLARVRAVAAWESDRADVARWVRSCPECREADPDLDPDAAPQRAEGPWSSLHVSLSDALPVSSEGFRALLVVRDVLSGWVDAFPLRLRAELNVARALLHEVFGRLGKVGSVLLAPAPSWMWDCLNRAPLRRFWSRLERSEPCPAAAGVCGAARAAGKDWARLLPLILAGARSLWLRQAELDPLLSVPGLALERRWRHRGAEGLGHGDGARPWLDGEREPRELRERLEAALLR